MKRRITQAYLMLSRTLSGSFSILERRHRGHRARSHEINCCVTLRRGVLIVNSICIIPFCKLQHSSGSGTSARAERHDSIQVSSSHVPPLPCAAIPEQTVSSPLPPFSFTVSTACCHSDSHPLFSAPAATCPRKLLITLRAVEVFTILPIRLP